MPRNESANCSNCLFASETVALGAPAVPCSIRRLRIEQPDFAVCANHPDHTTKPDRTPVGPVLRIAADGRREVLHHSPDTHAIRRHLIELIAATHVRDPADLSFRQATVIWQLEEFGERRTVVHLDRIRATVLPTSEHGGLLEFVLGTELYAKLGHDRATRPGAGHAVFLERFTLRGRFLLMAAGIVSILAFLAGLTLSLGDAAMGSHLSVLPLGGCAVLAGGGFLAAGVTVFRRLGIPFLATDEER